MIHPMLWRGSSAPSIWDDLSTARREVDRVFDRFLNQPGEPTLAMWAPVVDVRESANDVQISVELPGVSPEDVNVTVENSVLTISGEKRQEIEEGKEESSFHRFERRYGRFERSFSLPQSVEADAVKARFVNGVLHVTLPKAEAARPRKVQIEASTEAPGRPRVSSGKV